jgi:hypothetical protein
MPLAGLVSSIDWSLSPPCLWTSIVDFLGSLRTLIRFGEK